MGILSQDHVCQGDNGRLYAVESCVWLKDFRSQQESNLRLLDQYRLLFNPMSYLDFQFFSALTGSFFFFIIIIIILRIVPVATSWIGKFGLYSVTTEIFAEPLYLKRGVNRGPVYRIFILTNLISDFNSLKTLNWIRHLLKFLCLNVWKKIFLTLLI